MFLVPVVPKGHGHCLLRTGFVADIGCNSWEPPLHFRHPINSAPDGMEERDRKEKKGCQLLGLHGYGLAVLNQMTCRQGSSKLSKSWSGHLHTSWPKHHDARVRLLP
jgi:hypothetical protein